MQKINFIIVFISFAFISCKTEIYKNNKQSKRIGIKGNVKKITEIMLEPKKFSNNKYDTIKISNFYYNSNGQLKKSDLSSKYNDFTINYETKFKYNSKGQLTKSIGNEIEKNNETIAEYLYKNDKLNEVKIQTKNKSKIENYYYSNNKLLKSIKREFYINRNIKDTIISTTEYDENELVTNYAQRLDNKLRFKSMFKRDKEGIIKQMITKDSYSTDTLFYDYKFDKKGSWIMKIGKSNDTIRVITKRIIEYK